MALRSSGREHDRAREKAYLPCDLCGSSDVRFLFTCERLDGPLVRCRRCGLIYVGERREDFTFSAFDPERSRRLAERVRALALVDEEVEMREAPVRRQVMARRVRWVQRFVSRGRLLEIGCAHGEFLRQAAEAGFLVHGVEPDPATSARAREIPGAEVFAGTLFEARYPSAFFDVVVLFHVLEHLDSPRRTLHEIHRVLKPGGVVVVETPNVASMGFRLFGRRWRQFIPDHYFFFSPHTLRRVLEETGFQLLELTRAERIASWRLVADRIRRLHAPLGRWLMARIVRWGWADRTLTLRLGDVMLAAARRV